MAKSKTSSRVTRQSTMASASGAQRGHSLDDLGDHIYLKKQDKLRDIGVDIQTSQIVVVGSQSSGKSSLLENLTCFLFPRGQGLCTRYATQITLRRSPNASNVISITPAAGATQKAKDQMRRFRRTLANFEGADLASVIGEANKVMGIRPGGSDDEDMSLPMFSNDILKVEISGPDKPHLTVIDVPGLFQVTDEGRTTDRDKAMIEKMVASYMSNERTIVLAVCSCLADRATERVMQLAKSADPEGERTVGVLTKADLVKEKAVRRSILKLMTGGTLKLGYFVVRNRGADEDDLDIAKCNKKEEDLFTEPEWEAIQKMGRAGVQALKTELQALLLDLAKRELPKQRAEIIKRLEESRQALNTMGPACPDASTQRECLVKLTGKFERIVRDALEGLYEGNSFFDKHVELRLITKVVDLNEGFSDLMAKKGHTCEFLDSTRVSSPNPANKYERARPYETALAESFAAGGSFSELSIFHPTELDCAAPLSNAILSRIEQCYRETRGPELGTFGGALLARTFRIQSEKWAGIVRCHVNAAIIHVHRFLKSLLTAVFTDKRMREELWHTILLDRVLGSYRRAIEQAEFLIGIEMNGRPSTYNHYFTENLQKARVERLSKGLDRISTPLKDSTSVIHVNLHSLNNLVESKSNVEQVKEDVHDILKSYYKVARKRFVDQICLQVVSHFLLEGPTSPLRHLCPDVIMGLTESQLDRIAGESTGAKRERERLNGEVMGLEEAMEVLNS